MDGDGEVSAGEMLDRIANTGAAAMYLSSGTDWCLFQFSSVDIAEDGVVLGLNAGPEDAVQLHASLKDASAAAALYLILPVSAGMVLALLKGEKYAEA